MNNNDFTIKHAPPTRQSEKTFNYLMYSQNQGKITDSPWQRASGSSLADARKKVGDDLVEDPGMPDMVFIPSEVQAAGLRAKMMDKKYEDIVVTLVAKIVYNSGSSKGALRVESLRHSQVVGRVHELQEIAKKSDCVVKILIIYSEETGQVFGLIDLPVDETPRLPGYGKETDSKRTAYRNTSSGVIR